MTGVPRRPIDARRKGFVRRLLGPLHVTGVFWYRIHEWGVRKLPEWAIRFFLAIFTTFFFLVLGRIRRAVGRNLVPVLGPCGGWERQRRAYRTLTSFAWCLSEFYEQLAGVREAEVTIEGEANWRQIVERTEGSILMTAHVGHWDLGTMVPSERGGRTVHVVREEEMDPEAQEFLRGQFERSGRSGCRVHFAAADDPGLGIDLLSALRRGDLVALQGDRARTGARTLETTLFGRPYELPAGPLALARAAGVPLVPIFVFRDGRLKSRVVARTPIRVPRDRRDLGEAAEEIRQHLEWAISHRPHQWYSFRELWPNR